MNTQKQILGEFDEIDRECTVVLRQNGWDGQALNHWPSGSDYMRLRTRITNLVLRVCGESSSHYRNLVALSEEKNANDDTGKLLHY